MSDVPRTLERTSCRPCGRELAHRVGRMAGRLADLLETLPAVTERLPRGLSFLRAMADDARRNRPGEASPRLARLREGLGVGEREEELLVLAGMPEEHEGLASLFAALHPAGEAWATPGLASQLLAVDPEGRATIRDLLDGGRLERAGLVELHGSAPFGNRSLRPAPGVWSTLQGRDAWPETLGRVPRRATSVGLEPWLAQEGQRAVAALRSGTPTTLHVASEDVEFALDAAAALAVEAGRRWAVLRPATWSAATARSLLAHAALRGVVPILALDEPVRNGSLGLGALEELPDGLVLAGPSIGGRVRGGRPLLRLAAPRSARVDRRTMWRRLVPELDTVADELASYLRLPPSRAAAVAGDARHRAELEGRAVRVSDLTESVRGRVGSGRVEGADRVEPALEWEDLVLEPDAKGQLEAAADRLRHQSLVLDGWGLLRERRGVRGVRILLHGPPGTGKSLAAEALAGRLGVDLLVVDLSQVVSKWIGETEKNLGRIFDAAEEAQSVLLFDEADALFAQRTEVGDAHDRYANLETSYLLTRLERFEGLAVLSTNIKRNIDPAFLRRLDFVIELALPDAARREAIWAGHLHPGVPRAPDVSLREVADRYPVAGGLIRNAALGAAFLAAANGRRLTRDHLSHSLRREYAKAGLAFPGPLPRTAETED